MLANAVVDLCLVVLVSPVVVAALHGLHYKNRSNFLENDRMVYHSKEGTHVAQERNFTIAPHIECLKGTRAP